MIQQMGSVNNFFFFLGLVSLKKTEERGKETEIKTEL